MIRYLLILPVAGMCWLSTAWAQAPVPPSGAANSNAEAAALARFNAPTADYQIGPEDVLDISVWKNPELSRKVPVRPDGKVSLPLVNDIQAAGLTPSELREQLAKKLAEFVPTPEVAVIVAEVQSLRVSVVGAVKTPGRFMLKSPATVLECIALAQGLTEFANRDKIVVLRQEGSTAKRIPFNYSKVAGSSDQENFFVKPGDIIVVP
jgi:polysaccharide export outer membrane protein